LSLQGISHDELLSAHQGGKSVGEVFERCKLKILIDSGSTVGKKEDPAIPDKGILGCCLAAEVGHDTPDDGVFDVLLFSLLTPFSLLTLLSQDF